MGAVPDLDRLTREIAAGTPLEQLAAARKLADGLRARGDELLDHFVEGARASGASWTEIGGALGTSKQAAHERFGALAEPRPGPPPFGLTGTAADVLSAAADEARGQGHHSIRPEHIVLGLLARSDEPAGEVLRDIGVTAEATRRIVGDRLGTGTPRPEGSLGISPQCKRLLELARTIAKSLGHRCPRTEHILLAATSPRLHSSATTLLAECGAPAEKVQDELTRRVLREAPELAERLRRRSLLSRVGMRSL
jgi:hypothetical protein